MDGFVAQAKDVAHLWLRGFQASLSLWSVIKMAFRYKSIHRQLRDIFLVNGIFILGYHYFYNGIVYPFVAEKTCGDETNACISLYIAQAPYYALWIWPVYILSIPLNLKWYAEISEAIHKGATVSTTATPDNLDAMARAARSAAELLYGCVLGQSFLVQIALCMLIPHVGKLVAFIYACFLLSYQVFEYRLVKLGMNVPKRIAYVQSYWPYFGGFGTILAFVYVFCSFFTSVAIFNMLFPLFLIVTKDATPPQQITKNKYHLRVFCVAELIIKAILGLLSEVLKLKDLF